MPNLKYIGKNVLNHSLLLKKGNVSGSSASTGSFGLAQIDGTDLNTTGVARDEVLKFNGTRFVPAAYDDTFVFTISDFDMSHTSTPVLISTGSWKAAGLLHLQQLIITVRLMDLREVLRAHHRLEVMLMVR